MSLYRHCVQMKGLAAAFDDYHLNILPQDVNRKQWSFFTNSPDY